MHAGKTNILAASGAVSGVVSATLGTPADVVKSRMRVSNMISTVSRPCENKSFIYCPESLLSYL